MVALDGLTVKAVKQLLKDVEGYSVAESKSSL